MLLESDCVDLAPAEGRYLPSGTSWTLLSKSGGLSPWMRCSRPGVSYQSAGESQFRNKHPRVVTALSRARLGVVTSGGTVCVEAPGELAYRYVILRAVAAVCKIAFSDVCGRNTPAEGFTSQVISAVGEAFNNIALHCYRDRPSSVVRVRMLIDSGVLRLTIEDCGASFDPFTARLPNFDALPESGLGIYIIRSLMDEVTYKPGRPNVLSLSKKIRECPAGLPMLSGKGTKDGFPHE